VEHADVGSRPLRGRVNRTPAAKDPGYGSSWRWQAPWPHDRTSWDLNGGWGRGLYFVVGANNWYGHAQWSAYWYTAPGDSHVYQTTFGPVRHSPADVTRPVCLSQGLHTTVNWDSDTWHWNLHGDWTPNGAMGRGAGVECRPFDGLRQTHCVRADCTPAPEVRENKHAIMSQWIYGDAHRPGTSMSWMGEARTYLSDSEDPEAGCFYGTPNDGPNGTMMVCARDPGLGLRYVIISSPGNPNWSGNRTTDFNCYGTNWSPCPTGWHNLYTNWGTLPPGQQTIRVHATDAGPSRFAITP